MLFTTLVGDSFLNHFATVWIAKTITLINDYYFLAPSQIVTPFRYMSHHTYSCRFLVMEATFSCSFDCIAWWVLFTTSWLQYCRILSSSFRKDNLQKWSETLQHILGKIAQANNFWISTEIRRSVETNAV